jgi:hypothetical protein
MFNFLAPIKASAAALFEVPSSTPTSLTASITDTLAEPGVLAVVVFVAALPLIFWVVRRLIGLIPKGR